MLRTAPPRLHTEDGRSLSHCLGYIYSLMCIVYDYIFNFIHHKVAIKNNDKHKKLKAKYINLTKLN